jgi:hypothetical protein
MALGCAVAGGSLWLGGWLIAFFLLIYWPVMQAEATHMQDHFAEAYRRWSANVPLFIPRLTPYQSSQRSEFHWRQYLKHREYRALIGLAIVFGVLILKAAKIFG